MIPPLLICDVDGVLADFVGGVCDYVRRVIEKPATRDMCTEWSIRDSLGLTDGEWFSVTRYISSTGFAYQLPELPAVPVLLGAVARGVVRVQYCTTSWRSSPTWDYDRRRWLKAIMGSRAVTFTAEKHYVRGDAFVDDRPDTVAKWLHHAPPGQSVCAYLYDAPHNRGDDVPGAKRVRNMGELLADLVGPGWELST